MTLNSPNDDESISLKSWYILYSESILVDDLIYCFCTQFWKKFVKLCAFWLIIQSLWYIIVCGRRAFLAFWVLSLAFLIIVDSFIVNRSYLEIFKNYLFLDHCHNFFIYNLCEVGDNLLRVNWKPLIIIRIRLIYPVPQTLLRW